MWSCWAFCKGKKNIFPQPAFKNSTKSLIASKKQKIMFPNDHLITLLIQNQRSCWTLLFFLGHLLMFDIFCLLSTQEHNYKCMYAWPIDGDKCYNVLSKCFLCADRQPGCVCVKHHVKPMIGRCSSNCDITTSLWFLWPKTHFFMCGQKCQTS